MSETALHQTIPASLAPGAPAANAPTGAAPAGRKPLALDALPAPANLESVRLEESTIDGICGVY